MRRLDIAFPPSTIVNRQLTAFKTMAEEGKQKIVNGQSQFQEAKRAQFSFLTPMEKKCLAWLAQRLPGWVNSDHLTLLGFLAMFLAGLSFWLARWNPAGLLA